MAKYKELPGAIIGLALLFGLPVALGIYTAPPSSDTTYRVYVGSSNRLLNGLFGYCHVEAHSSEGAGSKAMELTRAKFSEFTPNRVIRVEKQKRYHAEECELKEDRY